MSRLFPILILSRLLLTRTFILAENIKNIHNVHIFAFYKVQEELNNQGKIMLKIFSLRIVLTKKLHENKSYMFKMNQNKKNMLLPTVESTKNISETEQTLNTKEKQTTFIFEKTEFKIYKYLGKEISSYIVSLCLSKDVHFNMYHIGLFELYYPLLVIKKNDEYLLSSDHFLSYTNTHSLKDELLFNTGKIQTVDEIMLNNGALISLFPPKRSSKQITYTVFKRQPYLSLKQSLIRTILKKFSKPNKTAICTSDKDSQKFEIDYTFSNKKFNRKENIKCKTTNLMTLNTTEDYLANLISNIIKNTHRVPQEENKTVKTLYPFEMLQEMRELEEKTNGYVYQPMQRKNKSENNSVDKISEETKENKPTKKHNNEKENINTIKCNKKKQKINKRNKIMEKEKHDFTLLCILCVVILLSVVGIIVIILFTHKRN